MYLSPEMEDAMRDLCEERGLDYDAVQKRADHIMKYIDEHGGTEGGVISIPDEVITGEIDS